MKFTKKYGFELTNQISHNQKNVKIIDITENGFKREYEILEKIDMAEDRDKMSVITRMHNL